MVDTLSDNTKYVTLSLLCGVLNGWLMGSTLRAADSYFNSDKHITKPVELSPQPKGHNLDGLVTKGRVHSLKDSGSMVTINFKTLPIRKYGDGIDDFIAQDIASRIKPILPKKCDSFYELCKAIAKNGHAFRGFFGVLLPVLEVTAFVYPSVPDPWKCRVAIPVITYLATGYYRGATDLGFWMNPIGVSFKTICNKFITRVQPEPEKKLEQEFTLDERRRAAIEAYNARNG